MVTLKTGPQLQVLGAATQSVSLGEMHEGVVLFRVKATDKLGSGNLSFSAGYGDKSARQSVDVSVRPASAYRTQVDVGRVDANSKVDQPDLRPHVQRVRIARCGDLQRAGSAVAVASRATW